jgi:hypothetical protein
MCQPMRHKSRGLPKTSVRMAGWTKVTQQAVILYVMELSMPPSLTDLIFYLHALVWSCLAELLANPVTMY